MNTVSVYNDRYGEKLLLHWDGVAPTSAPSNSIHSEEDIIHFWEHLKGYAKWYRRTSAFGLTFSKQNIKRLYNQFGHIPVVKGRERIDQLKAEQAALTAMIERAIKIKTLPVEALPVYPYKIKPLGDYQHREVVFLRNVPIAPIFADCGTGKTFCVLVSSDLQIKFGEIPRGKTLICGKLATLETGWMRDAKAFTDLNMKMLWLPTGIKNRKERIIDMLNEDADVYLINHDGVRLFENQLKQKEFLKVVVDESTILKGFRGMDPRIRGGQFAKALINVSHKATHRVIMSGTPAPNGPQDLWGQFAFLDPSGLFLEPSFHDFQNNYFQILDLRSKESRFIKDRNGVVVRRPDGSPVIKPLGPKDPKKWIPKKDCIERVSEIIGKPSFRVKIRDHIKDLPDLTIIKRDLDMTEEQAGHYKDMKEKLKVEIDDTRITVPMKITQIMKLRQITGGFIIDHQEKPHAIPDSPKLLELDSLLNEEIDRDNKVVIYCQYQWEVESIISRYKDHGIVSVYGGNTTAKNLKGIKEFIDNPKTRLIVLHPKSAAHGITFTMAHYMIFYSISHSAEDNYQCIKRIERAGQKNAMFIYYLLCKKSIDLDIAEIINLKDDNQRKLIDQEQFELINQNEIDQKLIDMWRKE